MTHEFSHNPIKLRIVDLKTGQWKKSYIFIGSVPHDIEKELIKLQNAYNKNRQVYNSNKLKKFYGKNWQYRLSVSNNVKGSSENTKNKNYDDLVSSMIVNLDDCDEDELTDDCDNQITGGDDDNNTPEFELPDVGEIPDFDLGDEILDEAMGKNTIIEVTEEDLEQANLEELIDKKPQDINILNDSEPEIKIESNNDIQFIFDNRLFPSDNILDFKNKIYLQTGIPIYRQHLWFKYRNKSIPAQYNISIFKNSLNINIERLIKFYTGEKEMNEIEGIPCDLDYYRNKDFINVSAQDTFNLLYTNFHKYGTDEYFLVDINDLIKPNDLYNKLKRDKYQLEVIYYGFVILYFPMITYTVFMEYLRNEKNIPEIFRELHQDKVYLRKKYTLSSNITEEAYQALDDGKEIRKKLYSSITSTIISIDNYKQDISSLLVLRNIFDILELTSTMTYCKANINYKNQNIILKKSYFNEPEPRETIPMNSLMIKIKTNVDTNEYMKLIIFINGNYIIKTDWREENHMDFDSITKTVSKKINPVIKIINDMGSRVKHFDIKIPDLDKNNIQFTETSFVFYYDDNVTESRFKVFKEILDDYQNSGIITSKENIAMGEEFFFNGGMYKFDASRIEKAISLSNYYDYLSNGIVKQKWETIFERTRLLQIVNVTSKLKISINSIRNNTEIDFFNLYLIGMLSLYHKNTANLKKIVDDSIENKSKKRLKNLKVQDPLLYDFKKIYKSNVIYSKICQKPYQPVMLNDDEVKKLPKERRANAIKYWNFTKEEPVWYSCPNMKYPHIKFIIKQHPKDFCIPCCKKIAMNENVNQIKQDIHNKCLKEHVFSGEKVSLTKGSHYIATYGKDIEVGRLSRLPEHTLEPLFFDTYSDNNTNAGIDPECVTSDGYYLFGVDQHIVSVEYIGYLYCLTHSLNMSVDDFLLDCSKKLKSQPSKFRVLLDGNASTYFIDNNELAKTISNLDDGMLLNKYENVPWNLLLMSIGYYLYGVNTIVFSDQNKEQIDMILPKGLKTSDEMFPTTHKNLVVLQKGSKYYPIYLLNTEIFKRTGMIDTRLFLNESGLITTIQAVVRRHFEGSTNEKIKYHIDLPIIKDFISKNPKLRILSYFINYANLCYAVYIEYDGKKCYMPIHTSHYAIEKNISLIFEPYNNTYSNDITTILNLYNIYNKYVDYESKKADLGKVSIYPKIEVDKWLCLKTNNKVIGFICNNIYYYCKPITIELAMKKHNKPIFYIMYDPNQINSLIHSIKAGKNKNKKKPIINKTVQQSMYQYYLYDLLVLQFISIFNKQKNNALRKELLSTLAKTDFDKNTSLVRDFIDNKIDDDEDKQKIKNIISRFINIHHNKRKMIEDINTSYFNFDKVQLEKMKRMSYKQVNEELHKLAKKFVKIGDISNKDLDFPNILMPCDQVTKKDSVGYCSGNKFIMKKTQLDNILSIIAYDITNHTKWKWIFNPAFVDKSVDFFKFIRRGPETIKVEFI